MPDSSMLGYARVSTLQQDTALQMAAFKRYGVRRVVEEKRSSRADRPVLERLLQGLQPGDVVVVYKVDRLARSLVDLLRILERVGKAGATFKSLTEPLETQTPVGRMMLQMLGAVAEFEREVIRERCAAGRSQAFDKGVAFGRPPRLDREVIAELRAQGLGQREIAARLECAESSVYRAWKGIRVCDGGLGERPSNIRLKHS